MLNIFELCTRLESVNISDLDSWCNISFESSNSNPCSYAQHLFLNGNELTSITIPDGLSMVKNHSFRGCSNIKSVIIPNSVKSIGEYNQEIKGETNMEIIPVSA